jgi:hypothetical protein
LVAWTERIGLFLTLSFLGFLPLSLPSVQRIMLASLDLRLYIFTLSVVLGYIDIPDPSEQKMTMLLLRDKHYCCMLSEFITNDRVSIVFDTAPLGKLLLLY